MDDNETIAEIIAEIRALSNPISDGIIAINGRSIADRLEAAHRRERGDAAKLREALKAISGLCAGLMPTWDGAVGRIKDMAETALAAPARNCDRPECATAKAAQEVWRREDGGKTAYYEWLLATHKKGNNDAD